MAETSQCDAPGCLQTPYHEHSAGYCIDHFGEFLDEWARLEMEEHLEHCRKLKRMYAREFAELHRKREQEALARGDVSSLLSHMNAAQQEKRLGGYERPSAEAWAAACNLRRRGLRYVGACPLCGCGDDRFVVHAETAVVFCNQCYERGDRTWFRRAIEAAGL